MQIRRKALARSRRGGFGGSSWASLFGRKRSGRSVGGGRSWECSFCGVIGSHRRGCHYVTETHHRGAKLIRRGFVGPRTRAARRASVAKA